MTIEYDEIRITTRREIVICGMEIRRLNKVVHYLEEKYTALQQSISPGL